MILTGDSLPYSSLFGTVDDAFSESNVTREAYRLSAIQLADIERGLVDELAALPNESGLSTVLLTTSDPRSDFARSYEQNAFAAEGYDFHEGMRPYEQRSLFLLTVDVDKRAVAHVKRIVRGRREPLLMDGSVRTGIEVLDDRLLAMEQTESATLPELLAYHCIIDLGKCLNLTSNISTGRCQPVREKPYSLVSYKAVFKLALALGIDNIFAYMNSVAMRSLSRLGVEFVKLAGKDFHLPMSGDRKSYDLAYEAVCIPGSRTNIEAFTKHNAEKPLTRLIAELDVPLYYWPIGD